MSRKIKAYCLECQETRELTIKSVEETCTVGGEPITIEADVAFCTVCGQDFSNEEMEDANTEKAFNIYRKKHGIPFSEEIKNIRETWGLSHHGMAKMLGKGCDYFIAYLFENGNICTFEDAEIIKRMIDPKQRETLLEEKRDVFYPRELRRIESSLQNKDEFEALKALDRKADADASDTDNGFRLLSFDKLLNMIFFFTYPYSLEKEKLMLLVWYAEALAYKTRTHSISGVRYVMTPEGPVFEDADLIFRAALETGEVNILEDGRVISYSDIEDGVLSEKEMKVLEKVTDVLKNPILGSFSKEELTNRFLEEQAAKNTAMNEIISFKYAKQLF